MACNTFWLVKKRIILKKSLLVKAREFFANHCWAEAAARLLCCCCCVGCDVTKSTKTTNSVEARKE
jgi:hypothetical protein